MSNDYFSDFTPLTKHTLARASAINALFQAIEAGFDLLPAVDEFGQNLYAADTGSANAYVVTLDPAPDSYTEGLRFLMKAANANTGESVVNCNTLGNVAIKRYDGSALLDGDIPAGGIVALAHNGTHFRIFGVHGASETAAAASATAAAASATAAANSATAAQTAESNAETAEANAETAEANAEGHYNTFRGIFLGAQASDPSTDPNGDAINEGDFYYNTTDNRVRWYNGAAFEDLENLGSLLATNNLSDLDDAVRALSNLNVSVRYRYAAKLGQGLSISTITAKPAICGMGSHYRVAFICASGTAGDSLRMYEFNPTSRTWAQVGNSLALSVGAVAITALSATNIALIDSGNAELRQYSFDGTDWTLVGSGLAISGLGSGSVAIAALRTPTSLASPQRVAVFDVGNDTLRTYEYSGGAWSQLGNALTISGISNSPVLTALNSTEIVLAHGSSSSTLRYCTFDGTDWTVVQTIPILSAGSSISIAALTSTDVAVVENGNDELRVYRKIGNSFTQVSTEDGLVFDIGASFPAIAAMVRGSPTSLDEEIEYRFADIAYLDDVNDELRAYRFQYEVRIGGAPLYSREDVQAIAMGNGIINGGCRVPQRSAPSLSNSYQYGQVDRFAAVATGTVGAGTISQNTSATIGSTGKSLQLAGVTLSGGSETVAVRHRMEANDARKYAHRTVTFAVDVLHDVGSAISYVIRVNKADSADDFSAVTLISSAGRAGIGLDNVDSDTPTTLWITVPDMGDCSNGIEIIVEADCGAITTKNFDFADFRIALTTSIPPFIPNRTYAEELAACQRYYEVTTASLRTAVTSGSSYGVYLPYKVRKRTDPTVEVVSIANASLFSSTVGDWAVSNAVSDENGANVFDSATGSGNGVVYVTVSAAAEL